MKMIQAYRKQAHGLYETKFHRDACMKLQNILESYDTIFSMIHRPVEKTVEPVEVENKDPEGI